MRLHETRACKKQFAIKLEDFMELRDEVGTDDIFDADASGFVFALLKRIRIRYQGKLLFLPRGVAPWHVVAALRLRHLFVGRCVDARWRV